MVPERCQRHENRERELNKEELKYGERWKNIKSERGNIALSSLGKKSAIKEEIALENPLNYLTERNTNTKENLTQERKRTNNKQRNH